MLYSGEDFEISSMYFRYFVLISPWKKVSPFIWINLNFLYPRMLWFGWNQRRKFGWNWPRGSGEEDFEISSMYFRYFVIIPPLEKSVALHLNKLESPLPKNALWLVEIGQVVLEKKMKCEQFTDGRQAIRHVHWR